jgi:hypothetical protein
VSVLSTAMKYVLHSIEIRTGEQWDNKGVFMLYADLMLGFIRVSLYMIFMIVMMKIHTFPLFAIRPMFIVMKYESNIGFNRCHARLYFKSVPKIMHRCDRIATSHSKFKYDVSRFNRRRISERHRSDMYHLSRRYASTAKYQTIIVSACLSQELSTFVVSTATNVYVDG